MSLDFIIALILFFVSLSYLVYYYGFKNRRNVFILRRALLKKIKFKKIDIFGFKKIISEAIKQIPKVRLEFGKFKKITFPTSSLNQAIKKLREKLMTVKLLSLKFLKFKREETQLRPTFLTKLLESLKTQKREKKEEPVLPEDLKIPEDVFLAVEKKWINEVIKNPKNIKAYKSLARLYYLHGDYTESKEALETLIKLGAKDNFVNELQEKLKKLMK